MRDADENDLIWKKGDSRFEIRTQGELPDGQHAIDEIVATGAAIHLEQMNHAHWWMGIEVARKYFHLNCGVRDRQLFVELSDQSDDQSEYATWEGTVGSIRYKG